MTDNDELRTNVLTYLAEHRWVAPTQLGHVGGVWRHRDSDALLPIPNVLVAGSADWQVIIDRLARIAGSPAVDITALLTDNGQSRRHINTDDDEHGLRITTANA